MSRRTHVRNHSPSAGNSQDREYSDPALLAIRYGMDNTLELVEDLIPSCPTDADRQMVSKRLQILMLKFIKSEMSYLESNQMINQVGEEVPDDENMNDKEILASCDKILPIAEERLKIYEATLTEDVLKEHHMFTNLIQKLQMYQDSGNSMNEESILADDAGTEHIPTVDPITKQKLTDPVRNTKCKHIYGHAAILQLIKKNSKTRCPTMGCSNNAFIKAKDLVSDPRLNALVRKKQAEQEDEDEEEEDES